MGSTVSGWDGFEVGRGMFLKDNVAERAARWDRKLSAEHPALRAGRLILEGEGNLLHLRSDYGDG